MKSIGVIITVTIALVGCASMKDPTLAFGVDRADGGIYSVSELSAWLVDPDTQAVKQCKKDGNKMPFILSRKQLGSIPGRNYVVFTFRCD